MQASDLLNYSASIKTEADLKRMITDRVKEDLYLEFKQKHDRSHGKLEEDDKSNLSKALSGFANSDGGILIWGIETHKKDESAKSLKPITNIDDFIRSLKSSLLSSVQPFVDDVTIEKIPTDASEMEGYVKCLIPLSYKTPHRAMLAGREYYKRSTEGFYRLEHFDLEDMFGRRQKPLLVLQIRSEKLAEADPEIKKLLFSFVNEGREISRHYGFFCKFDENIELLGSLDGRITDISNLNDGHPTISYNNDISVIHPNNISHQLGAMRYKRKNKTVKIHGFVSYYCQGMSVKSLEFETE